MTGPVFALSGRTLRVYLRTPQLVIATVAFPLLMMFVMLAVLGRLVGTVDEVRYVQRLVPLVALSTISFSASLTAVGFWFDTHGPMFDRVRTMTVPPWSLLAGRLVGDLVRIVLVAAVVTGVAYLPGFRFSRGLAGALGYFAVVLLLGALFSALAAWVGTVAKSPTGASGALNAPMIALYFLSIGYLPQAAFPGFLQPIAWANPLSAGTQAMVGLSAGGPVATPMLLAAAWTVLVVALAAIAVTRRFRARPA